MTFHPPKSPDEAHVRRVSILKDYDLTLGQEVEVELLVRDGGQTRLLEGQVIDATAAVLVLSHKSSHRRARIPWTAIAAMHNPPTRHPANS